ncbi:MAG TPA: patatin-like phospholipase family protein [Planktothrix sp.]
MKIATQITRTVLMAASLIGMQSGNQVFADQLAQGVRLSVDHLSPPTEIQEDLSNKLTGSRPHIVVALGGGGSKCVAQIGVLRSLEKHNVHIDAIVGSSMGSVVGALYCAGVPLDRIEEMFVSNEISKSISPKIALKIAAMPVTKLIPFHHHRPYAGFINGDHLEHLLQQNLPPTFEGLKVPFVAVATDLTDGRTTVLSKGNLSRSILASMAFPIYFRPVQIGDKVYSDGGVRSNLPARVAADQFKADVVIAVPVDESIKPVDNAKFKKLGNVRSRAIDIMVAALDANQAKKSDVLIYPNTDDIPILTNNRQLMLQGIAKGEAAADKAISQINQAIADSRSGAQASVSTPE